MSSLRRRRIIASAIVAGLAGYLFTASSFTAEGTNLRTGGVEDLRGLVISRAQEVAKLTNQVDQAQKQVDAVSGNAIDPALTAKIGVLEQNTGLLPVTGSALVVELKDAARTPGTKLPVGVGPDDLVVHQQDVQAVVNAMWRGGATGVQVMDQRIISTSAIRCVGNTLFLQGRVYSPPFVIKAVGDVSKLQNALNSEPGVKLYKEYVDLLNLGWKVSIQNSATLPAWSGSIGQ